MTGLAEAVTSKLPSVPDTLPVLPLRDTVVYPLAVVPLVVGQERSIKLVNEVMRKDRMMALVAQKGPEAKTPDDLYRIGTAAVVHQLMRAPDGTLRLVVQGIERIRVVEFTGVDPFFTARVETAPDPHEPGPDSEGLLRATIDLYRRLVAVVDELPAELVQAAESLDEPRQAAYLIASTGSFDAASRQRVLELEPVDAKLRKLVEMLQHEVGVRELGRKITGDVEERITKAQREHYLHEQMRAIQKELGGEEGSDAAALKQRIEEAGLPEEARRETDRELARLQAIPSMSPEHGIIRTYLDWMASLPWSRLSGGDIDLARARQVLDEDHYDLERIKERLLEYLAVRKLRQERRVEAPHGAPTAPAAATPRAAAEGGGEEAGAGEPDAPAHPVPPNASAERGPREPILCFAGPPGVGKTSLGQSIARALGRQFVRMSLGGVHDEAEVRGHRRTYIGAMPGRIIQGLKRAGTRDPIFMLDEIDKLTADWRGDPSSALLEVLDPAQNHAFADNYLGVSFDLSQVLFIATANSLETIPPPLRDRMEILQLAGYTELEKVQIAERYLVPKQIEAHGLRPDEIAFEREAIAAIVRGYTREAGVRNLEREVANVCRKVASAVAEGKVAGPVAITPAKVEELLRRPRFQDEAAERTDRPGVATGLAWTPTGGDVLFVEATMMPARDERLILTGMLGDVMRESAQAALSYVRSNAEQLGFDPEAFEGKAVHVHVPAGAIPKDGPSAGVTMLTALASLASGRVVRGDLAMTGEITLRGKVLPVGGIKEKVLAAHRAGIRTIILPRKNERDLEDVPEELRRELRFEHTDSAGDVLRSALAPEDEPA